MRVAVVGPAPPLKGGVALHTTYLCRALDGLVGPTALIGWRSPYPRRLYPGELRLPASSAEAPRFRPSGAHLDWYDPVGWWMAGRVVRSADLLVLVHVVPAHVPALLTVARAASAGAPPQVCVIAHNVLPHEGHPGDSRLVGRLLRSADRVVVHSRDVLDQALALDPGLPVVLRPMPPHLPTGICRVPMPPSSARVRLLMLGTVRPYKGVDVALAALAAVPDAELVIAGEFWVSESAIRQEVTRHGLADRVVLRPGYVPAGDLPGLVATCDALLLPYRHASASQNVWLAQALGRPVIATRVGSFPDDVRDGTDGLLCEPGDALSLAQAIRQLALPGVRDRLAAGAVTEPGGSWDAYARAVAGC